MAESLTLRLLGAPLFENSLGLIPLARRKSTALLAYLALEPSYHARDSLAALLWPEFDRSRSRANLRSCLFEIGHATGQGALLVGQENVGLATTALRAEYCVILERLGRGLQGEGRLNEAEDCARRWVEAEPYEEEARRRQIQLLLLMGRRSQAVDRFEDWSRTSMEELGSPPKGRRA